MYSQMATCSRLATNLALNMYMSSHQNRKETWSDTKIHDVHESKITQ